MILGEAVSSGELYNIIWVDVVKIDIFCVRLYN